MTEPIELLEAHQERIREWREQLYDRRAKLRTLRETLADSDREDIPEELLDSLVELLDSLEGDLTAQIDDLDNDLEMITDLQSTFEEVNRTDIEEQLESYAGELSDVFEDKRQAIENLIDATDELTERFEDLITGRYRE